MVTIRAQNYTQNTAKSRGSGAAGSWSVFCIGCPKFYQMKISNPKIRAQWAPGIFLLLLTAACTKSSPTASFVSSMSAQVGSHIFNATQVEGIYSRSLGLIGAFGAGVTGSDSAKLFLEFPFSLQRSRLAWSDTSRTSVSYFSGKEVFTAFPRFGRVEVSLYANDTVNHIFEGAFTGILYNPLNSSDSLKINGKFNSTYSVQP